MSLTSFTENLNSAFDKWYEFLYEKSAAGEVGFKETRLIRIMDYLGSSFAQIDSKKRGYFYIWEFNDYLKNGPKMKGLKLNDEEFNVLQRYAI